MNIKSLVSSDASVAESLKKFYKDPNFEAIRVAFVSHCESTKDESKSAKILHGQYLGVRQVFNTIEEIVTAAGAPKPSDPVKREGVEDPDLSSKPISKNTK